MTASTLRLYVNGTQVAVDCAHGLDRDFDEPAGDRWRQHLRPVLRGPDRRGSRLQRRPHRRPDPNRRGHPDQPARHHPAVAAGDADRERRLSAARSTSPGAPPPTTSASPATRSSAARAPAAATSPRSPPQPAPAIRTPASAPTPATATAFAPPMPPATSAPTRTVATATTSLSVTPGTAVLTFTRTAQFVAQGSGSGTVTWSVDGVRRRQCQCRHDHCRRALYAAQRGRARIPSRQLPGLSLPTQPST